MIDVRLSLKTCGIHPQSPSSYTMFSSTVISAWITTPGWLQVTRFGSDFARQFVTRSSLVKIPIIFQ
jgi:hypothetical protein